MAKYKLMAGSVTLLRSIIGYQGSAKTPDEMYRAGKLLVVTLPTPETATPEETEKPVEFEMDGPELDFCKSAIKHALQKEILSNSKFSYDLSTTLELVSIPKTP